MLMKTTILLILGLLTFSTYADCYKYAGKDVISWTAFKTPAKAGVGGEFKKFTITPKIAQGTLDEMLNGATFEIDTTSVHTKNAARDKKIVKNFFSGVTIKGKVASLSRKEIEVDFMIKDTKRSVPMSYEVKNGKLLAKATIDVFDFMLHDNLKAINKACYALHEGKTWNDVNIALETTLEDCK